MIREENNFGIKPLSGIILLLGGIWFLIISYLLISESLRDEYIQILLFILGVIFGIFGGINIITLTTHINKRIEENHLILCNLVKEKRIDLRKIKSYILRGKETRSEVLLIFTEESSYKIYSSLTSNYGKLKKELIKGKKENKKKKKRYSAKFNKRYGLVFIMIGLLLLLLGISIIINHKKEIKSTMLYELDGELVNEIGIKKSGKKGYSSLIEVFLKEYPKFRFVILDDMLRITTIKSLRSEVKVGEQIKIQILSEDYKKKISKEKKMSIWEKSINYKQIKIYGLKFKEREYLSLEDYNKNIRRENNFLILILLLFFSLSSIGYGANYLLKNKSQ